MYTIVRLLATYALSFDGVDVGRTFGDRHDAMKFAFDHAMAL